MERIVAGRAHTGRGSSLLRVSPVTRDFQSDSPLHPRASELLNEYFAQGWPDPKKIHRQSAHLRTLLNSAQEQIASALGSRPDNIEFLGELGFGFWLGLTGLLPDKNRRFIHSAIDRQVVHGVAKIHQDKGGAAIKLLPDSDGMVQYNNLGEISGGDLLCWQATNRESGAEQSLPPLKDGLSIFADMTASYELDRLPEKWDVALWDPKTFGGPQGISIIGFASDSKWRNPAPSGNRRVFGSFSKPLLLATAVALEENLKSRNLEREHLTELNQVFRARIATELPQVTVPGNATTHDPRFLALVVPDVISEELLRRLESDSFLIDAGSACAAGPLSPSHVLEAMGYGIDGHIRITLKPEHRTEDILDLVAKLKIAIADLSA